MESCRDNPSITQDSRHNGQLLCVLAMRVATVWVEAGKRYYVGPLTLW